MERGCEGFLGSCIGALSYLCIHHTVIAAFYLSWDVISIRNVLHQQNNETVWSVLTAVDLTLAWILIPVLNLSIIYGYLRFARVVGYILMLLTGPVLLVVSAFGSLAGVEPLLNWCPMSSFCWDNNIYPFLELITWDLLFLVSVLCSYLWYRATYSWAAETHARLRYRRMRAEVLDLLDRESIHSDRESVCAICLDEFHRDEDTRRIPRCHHHFHAACIDKWFESNLICPVCRAPVFERENNE